MKVRFLFQKEYALKNRTILKSVMKEILKRVKKNTMSVDIIFCSDSYLLAINKKYLRHDFYTDIITFDLSQGDQLVGELYISIDRVKENARSNKVRIPTELARVIIHGCLHLIGFQDKSPREKIIMSQAEDKYLNLVSRKTVSL